MKKIKSKELNLYETILRYLPLFFTLGFLTAFKGYRLYFSDLHISLGYFESFLVIVLAFCVTQYIVNSNIILRTTKMGIIMGTALTIEIICSILFAQYHLFIALFFTFAIIFFALKLKKYIFDINKDRIITEKQKRIFKTKSNSFISVMVCLALLVPSIIGIYDEYYKYSLSAEDWASFVEWFNEGSNTESTKKDNQNIPTVLKGIDAWDKQNKKEKERIIRSVALLEKEHFGIADNIDIVVTTEKLSDGLYGYYDDHSNSISINFEHLIESPIEDVIKTILHEMHHAYVYYTVSVIDFSSDDVKTNFYYEKAREWKENTENYVSASENYDKYQNQPIETDARDYANERIEYYLQMINS